MPKIDEVTRNQVIAAKQKNPDISGATLGKMFGIHKSTANDIVKEGLTNRLENALRSTVLPAEQQNLVETDEQSENQRTITLPKTNLKTLEELIEHCKIDLQIWSVERFLCNQWAVGAKDNDNKIQVTPLFQVKAWLKKKVEIVDARAEIESLREQAKSTASFPRHTYIHNHEAENMLEVNIPDLHAGKLAWSEETGGPNYDTKIAVATFWKALETLLYRVSEHKFSQVLFVVGNDLLNSDDMESQTTAGTRVSSDVRYQKTFSAVRDLKIRAIERLRMIAPVKVVIVPGNHDTLSCWHLGDSLSCYFHKYPDVTVDNSPLFRKYHQFGQVMLLLCHGHKGKHTDYPLTMATEEPKMFGSTKFREAHTGHKHGLKADEYHGVRVRILSSLTPADAWHSENLFIGNLRSAELYVWNKNEGLIGTAIYTDVDN